jgi:hypothetical protein
MSDARDTSTPETFEEQTRFICPFCKRSCSFGEIGGTPCGLHDEPACQKFLELALDDYLHEVNIQYGAHN